MAENNETNKPSCFHDAESFVEYFKKPQDLSGFKRSITFDPLAQNQLPKKVIAKMQADRHQTQIDVADQIDKIEKILNDYRRENDFSDYRLAAYISKIISDKTQTI